LIWCVDAVIARKLFDYYQREGEAAHHQKAMYADSSHRKLMMVAQSLLCEALKENSVFLDVGCAEGLYTRYAGEKDVLAVGVDISLPKLKRAIAESNMPNIDYVLASWDRIPLQSSSVDVALFLEGLEHSLDPKLTMKEVARVIAEKGTLILSAPLWDKKVGRDPFARLFDGHLRSFTVKSLEQIVRRKFRLSREISVLRDNLYDTGFLSRTLRLLISTKIMARLLELVPSVKERFSAFIIIHGKKL